MYRTIKRKQLVGLEGEFHLMKLLHGDFSSISLLNNLRQQNFLLGT